MITKILRVPTLSGALVLVDQFEVSVRSDEGVVSG